MQHIIGMRSEASRNNYIDLLDSLVKGVVTYKLYKKNRTTKPLSEWVTNTDEAFILLCLHNYSPKWRHEHWVKLYGPPNNDNEQQPGPESLYTGPERGTKRSWSREGLAQFNTYMINVYRDRQENGPAFDEEFLQEMKSRYDVPAPTANNTIEDIEAAASGGGETTVVYNDFNLDSLMARANEEEDYEDVNRIAL